MEIKEITYQRIKNLENYESERMQMTAELAENEDLDQCVANLKKQVEVALGIDNEDESVDDLF